MILNKLVRLLVIGYIALDFSKMCQCSLCGCNGIPQKSEHHGSGPPHHAASNIRPNHYRPDTAHHSPLKLQTSLGDSCGCSKTLLKPAKISPTTAHSSKSPQRKGAAYPSSLRSNNLPKDRKQSNSIGPADPVSQSLAIRRYNAINVPEAMLAFGFERKPIDSFRRKTFYSDVPEEELFKLNNRIIVLGKFPSLEEERPFKCGEKRYGNNLDCEKDQEKPYDRRKEAQPQRQRMLLPPCPTYSMLGFLPENFKNPEFKRLRPFSRSKHRQVVSSCKPRYDCECRRKQFKTHY